jgi:hypothetical protein
MPKKAEDQYSPQEAKERMRAALLGARIAGPMPMQPKKKPKAKKARKKQRAAK